MLVSPSLSELLRFVDCDDLNDLTRLFSYVGQDTETLVVLASPDILTRKWCVGEICTARIQRHGEASNSESQSASRIAKTQTSAL